MVDATDLGSHRDLTLSSDKRERWQRELDKLMRYDEEQYCVGMRIADRGEFVRYEQVKKLLDKLR